MSENSRRYVIVTPFKKVDVLAGFCKMNGLDVWVIPSAQGAMVVHDLPVPVFDDWDISELLGSRPADDADTPEAVNTAPDGGVSAHLDPTEADTDPERSEGSDLDPAPGQTSLFDDDNAPSLFDSEKLSSLFGDESVSSVPTLDDVTDASTPTETREPQVDEPAGGDGDESPTGKGASLSADDRDGVARMLAKLSRAGVLVLTSELGEDVGNEIGVSGLVTAQVVDSTGFTADTPAGLIVATGEPILEDLLLGDASPEDVPGAIRSGSIDTSAIERLAGGAKDPGKPLPPRRPRRFFGKDSS
ncbi:hypothetical protein [Flaviflexus huanghaiensis]|uniref:hypothetical protein n=1 Tax=Flaviflexus huanghaiensis TaxID=1111473 RepID=UPI0015F8CBA8|nr:hypothetical protein [Flaviflexus huanghaiensis]